jgi:hypothetical protein
MQVLGAAEKRMNRYPLLAPFVGCSAALALAGCAANFSTSPTFGSTSAHAGPMHVLPYFPTRYAPHAIVRGLSSGVGVLRYDNGPALLKPKAYLIFWGYKKYGDPDKVAPLLEAYFKAVGGSSCNAVYTQYYDVAGSKTNDITNFKRQLGGVWFDDEHLVPAEPTDAQVAQESLQGVSHFGYDVNGSYIVATPRIPARAGTASRTARYRMHRDGHPERSVRQEILHDGHPVQQR